MKYHDGKNLEGKVAIVTGASRGIGYAISKMFTLNKIKVYMISQNKRRLEEAANRIRKIDESKDLPAAFNADVKNGQEVKKMFSHVIQREGKLDILVNNAGVGVFKPFLQTTLEDFRRVFQVNVEGAFLCCKEAFNIMKKQNQGIIVNMGSIVSMVGYPNQSIYTASKHALLGLTKVLAKEGRRYNIQVVAVCPGGVRTDMAKELRETIRPDLTPESLMDPEDVANAVLFMIGSSEKAAIDNIVVRRQEASPYF